MRNPFARRAAGDELPGSEVSSDHATREAAGKGGPASATFTLRDLLVVTYALPAERVRPHIPTDLPLDMLPGPDGERLAFIQTVCAFHADARWSLMPEGAGQSFHQLTHRALVRREGRRGAFMLRTLVGGDEARSAQRAMNRDVDFARFSVYIAGDPARATYQRYTARAVSDTTQAQFDIRIPAISEEGDAPVPPPLHGFPSATEAAAFLVDRPDNYFRASAPRSGIGLLSWKYGPLVSPLVGIVTAARVGLWTTPPLEFIAPDDLLKPHSVLIVPSVEITASMPRYAKFK